MFVEEFHLHGDERLAVDGDGEVAELDGVGLLGDVLDDELRLGRLCQLVGVFVQASAVFVNTFAVDVRPSSTCNAIAVAASWVAADKACLPVRSNHSQK